MESNHLRDLDLARRVEARIDMVLAFRKTVTPLAVAQLLLGSVLTLSAGLTLLGRPRVRTLALQAIVAYAIFLPLDYVLRQPMRAFAIDAFADGSAFPAMSGDGATLDAIEQRTVFWWVYRGALAVQLLVLILGFIAMTRPRVRAFFAALSAERARQQEP